MGLASDLQGKVAIITGAGSGIGAATAETLADLGAKVVLVGRRLEKLEEVASKITAKGGTALPLMADLASEEHIAAMVEKTMASYGRIDVLHNNAALTDSATMAADGAIHEMDAAAWDKVMLVNLRGPMLCCKYVIPHMLKQASGSIIMSGSGKGTQGDLGQPAYGASKAGLINLAQNIATQYGKQGIRANVVVIGMVLTEGLANNIPEPIQVLMESHHLTPHLGTAEQIANAVAFLASDASGFITGQSLNTDGGFLSHAPSVADLRKIMAGH